MLSKSNDERVEDVEEMFLSEPNNSEAGWKEMSPTDA